MEPLIQHPLSAAFPPMDDADFMRLKDNIDDDGQRDPIVVFGGMVLDGWHRYRACLMIGFEPKIVPFEGDDPAAFVISRNLHRRHLTGSQRAAAVVACNDWVRSGANQHTKAGGAEPGSTPQTTAEMAKVAQTSDRTIRDAKVAHTAGLSDAIKCGSVTAKGAAAIARGALAKAAKPDSPAASGRTTTQLSTAAEQQAQQVAEDAHGDFDPIAELEAERKENGRLRAQIEAAEADDQKAQTLKWQRIASIAQARQNELMSTVNDREAELKRTMTALRRCGAAVGEENPLKVAVAVEALARSARVPEPV